jgi:hypothetical protein
VYLITKLCRVFFQTVSHLPKKIAATRKTTIGMNIERFLYCIPASDVALYDAAFASKTDFLKPH